MRILSLSPENKNAHHHRSPVSPQVYIRVTIFHTAMIRPESVSPGHDSHWNVSPLYIIYITVYDMFKK